MAMHRAFAKINMKQETVHENMLVKDFPNHSDSARIELWRRERLHNRNHSDSARIELWRRERLHNRLYSTLIEVMNWKNILHNCKNSSLVAPYYIKKFPLQNRSLTNISNTRIFADF